MNKVTRSLTMDEYYSLFLYLSTQSEMILILILQLKNKVDVQFPYILMWKLHAEACKIVAGTERKLCKKFQVDICKT